MQNPKTAEAVRATAAESVQAAREADPDRITDSAQAVGHVDAGRVPDPVDEAAAAIRSSIGEAVELVARRVKADESVEDKALVFRRRIANWLRAIMAEAVVATDAVQEDRDPESGPGRIRKSVDAAAAFVRSEVDTALEECAADASDHKSAEDRAYAFRKRLAARLSTISAVIGDHGAAESMYAALTGIWPGFSDLAIRQELRKLGEDPGFHAALREANGPQDFVRMVKRLYQQPVAFRRELLKRLAEEPLARERGASNEAAAAPRRANEQRVIDHMRSLADDEIATLADEVDKLVCEGIERAAVSEAVDRISKAAVDGEDGRPNDADPEDAGAEEEDEALPVHLSDPSRSAGGCAMNVRVRVDECEDDLERFRTRAGGCNLGLDSATVLVQLEDEGGSLVDIAAVAVSGPVGTTERLAEHVESAVRQFADAQGPNVVEDSIGRKVDREPPADRADGYELVEITVARALEYSVNASGVDLQEESIVFIGERGAAEKLTDSFRELAANRCKRWAAAMRAKPKANGNGSGQHVEPVAEPVAVEV